MQLLRNQGVIYAFRIYNTAMVSKKGGCGRLWVHVISFEMYQAPEATS